jgi:hypothetical protein
MSHFKQRFLIGLIVMLAFSATAAENQIIAIIINKTNKMRTPDEGDLSLIFMRKKLYFADGERIQPINLPANHPIRKQFSLFIFGDLLEAQADYWNEAYYHGIFPPHVVGSEDAAIRFVEVTPNAIAYINACKLTDTVKVVAWVDVDKGVLAHAPALNCQAQD